MSGILIIRLAAVMLAVFGLVRLPSDIYGGLCMLAIAALVEFLFFKREGEK